jgi:hypothetical protein
MALRSLAICLLLAGCSSESADASGTGGSAGGGGSAGSAGQAGSAGAPCSEDPSTIPPGAVCLLETTGRIVDAAGAPVPKLLTSVCGPICYTGESGDDGRFVVTIDAHILPIHFSTLPHGRPALTSFYFQLPTDIGSTVDVGDLLVLPLPATGPTLISKQDGQGAPAQTVTAGEVTLDVADGVSVRIDVEDVVLGAEGRMFRALRIPDEHRAKFAAPSLGIEVLYALTPFEAAFVDAASGADASARLSFENTLGWAPGSAVEVLALGTYLYPTWVTPAAFEVVATAAVSADGTQIELDAGAGLAYLTWVGLRPKP